jgi:hypothetical protein
MDNEYILMCKSATEIQKGWKPKGGNRFIDAWGHLRDCEYDIEKKSGSYLLTKQQGIFLPRQEDLQEIYLEPYKGGLHVSTMINTFYHWFWEEYNNKIKSCLEQYNWNEMWLCFVMESLYNKRWNTETKEWEETF